MTYNDLAKIKVGDDRAKKRSPLDMDTSAPLATSNGARSPDRSPRATGASPEKRVQRVEASDQREGIAKAATPFLYPRYSPDYGYARR